MIETWNPGYIDNFQANNRENKTVMNNKQPNLFGENDNTFPNTRYRGSKLKLVDWIFDEIKHLDFDTCLDAFGGTGAVSYKLKKAGKKVVYNDKLRFNYFIGKAFIENASTILEEGELNSLFKNQREEYPSFIYDTFHDIYFTDEENKWIDLVITNINSINDEYKKAIALFGLFQTCIIKRPYNLFHRKNLYMRIADVERSFGNKTSWDRDPEEWMREFVQEANNAIFDNGRKNKALNYNALEVPGEYDLVYIDTPYITKKGSITNYLDFYHFLEGLTDYDSWGDKLNHDTKHLKMESEKTPWHRPNEILDAFDNLFKKYNKSILVVSYRSDGIPTIENIKKILGKNKEKVHIHYYGKYKYALSKNSKSKEVILIAE